jgi:CRISPR-associated endonuclease Cas1
MEKEAPMAATGTLPDRPPSRKLIIPSHGVVTLYGYGITAHVDRGHLILKDGVGIARRESRFPRVGHGLRRLVVIGADGFVSLAALRWLADQDAAFVLLERDGSVLATTGPVRPTDARLRRAQSLASTNGMALEISKDLIRQKLAAQEQIAREKLNDSRAAQLISEHRAAIDDARTIETLRLWESRAAYEYWSAWRKIPITFPTRDLTRVPQHWQHFGARVSPLTGSPRLAVNPPNAMLNYLYAILESEALLAAAALGLDPGIGVMHVDSPARDSLACDLMEPVRPQVDAYVFQWISREPIRREWFFEQRDGNCRLMASLAARLSETAAMWGQAVAPIAEWVARTLSLGIKKQVRTGLPATRLTQSVRRDARPTATQASEKKTVKPMRICRTCGDILKRGQLYCKACALPAAKERFGDVARLGRIASHTDEAEICRAKTRRRHAAALKRWDPTALPDWLTEEVYREKIQPALAGITVPAIANALGISEPYATNIRKGKRVPHPRHWQILAKLVLNEQSNDGSTNDELLGD